MRIIYKSELKLKGSVKKDEVYLAFVQEAGEIVAKTVSVPVLESPGDLAEIEKGVDYNYHLYGSDSTTEVEVGEFKFDEVSAPVFEKETLVEAIKSFFNEEDLFEVEIGEKDDSKTLIQKLDKLNLSVIEFVKSDTSAEGILISDNFQDGNGNAPFNLQVRNLTGDKTTFKATVEDVPYSEIPDLSKGDYKYEVSKNEDSFTHVFSGELEPFKNIEIKGGLPIPAGIGKDSGNPILSL